MEHTKGEWQIIPYTRRDSDNIRWVKTVGGKTICQTFKPNAEAKAREIVRCHNAFEDGGLVEELRTACKELMEVYLYADGEGLVSFDYPNTEEGDEAKAKAEAALAKS